MSSFSTLVLVSIVAVASDSVGKSEGTACDSPQYLELGKVGTVHCVFPDNFFGVLWYNTTEDAFNDPLLDYRNFIKKGTGYSSGEFDVHANGSLIINNVSIEHEHAFKVAYLNSKVEEPVLIDVEIFVLVRPSIPFPVFANCGNRSNICYATVYTPSLPCSVHLAKPAIPLHVVARTVMGDKDVSSTTTITPEGIGYTSRVITKDVFDFQTLLVLLVCKASDLPRILDYDESYLLAQNGHISLSSNDVTVRYIEQSSRMNLSCADTEFGFIVWKKAVSVEDKNPEVLLYSVNIGEQFTKIFADDVTLEDNTSLILLNTKVIHSGYYYCLFGDGVTDGASIYDVVVFVNPSPAYPVIDGCNHEQYCVLETENRGTLTCTVKGIRPDIQLKWQTFHNNEAPAISFSNNRLTVKDNGGTFDVTLMSTYRLNDESRDKLTVECKTPSLNGVPFHLTTKIDLLFVNDANSGSTEALDVSQEWRSSIWVIPFIVVLLLTACLVFGVTIKKRAWKDRKMKTEEEELDTKTPLVTGNHPESGKVSELKDEFLKQIKEKYEDMYNAVQPIPYIKDRLFCVDRVFIEGGIEFLDSRGVDTKDLWKDLESYNDVFNDPRVKSKRRILEGEPGYGKSTLTLQFAYDWCNSVSTSPLKDVEILILLRLRQLRGVPSIYKGIERFLLPKESPLSEADVKYVLTNCKSVVVILDGFDEYPDLDKKESDVIKIIEKHMFFEYEVVLTTRSSLLPKTYPATAKRMRLTGFDDNARRYYIRKVVVGDDEEKVRKIVGNLENNPILSDLCQVPLLFVIFAHMTFESEQFRKLDSVTSFFRYMISSFHSHMRNKMHDENVRKYEIYETDHHELDKLAFEAFSGQSQKIVWEKDEICQQVGQEFYDQYFCIGILVEEEVFDIIDDPGTLINEHIHYKTEVRFYHKLFCEWYAAHYVADFLEQNPNLDLGKFLRHLDPFDLQYLYRFACGINSNSAEKIINYLKNIEGGDKFAILCILEQTGKIDNIRETICQLCNVGVLISGHDNLLLQRSSMQLLEIATRNNIPINFVNLHNCFESVDLSEKAITTISGPVFTSRIRVTRLRLSVFHRELEEYETIAVLKFSSMMESLQVLRLSGSVPPRRFDVDSYLSTLKAKNVQVRWRLFTGHPLYILNLQTGRWEDEGKEMTNADFERLRSKFHENLKQPEEFHKGKTKEHRHKLRKAAEERSSVN